MTSIPTYGLFHAADLHSGAFRFLDNYLDRTAKALKAIEAAVLASPARIRVLVLAGDLHDRPSVREDERNLVVDFVTRLVAAGVHVVIINGNHDFLTESQTTLEIYKFMARLNPNLHVVLGDPGFVSFEGLAFGCVPCQQDMTTERLTGYAKQFYVQAQASACKAFYMVIHETVYGAVNNRRTWKADSDKYLRIPDLPFVTGWMLGDIHNAQEISPNARYSGAPLQIKSDESERCGILQWAGSKARRIILNVPGFRTTDDLDEARTMAAAGHVVRYSGDREQLTPEVLQSLPQSVVLTGDIQAVALDMAAATAASAEAIRSGTSGVAMTEYDMLAPLPKYLAAQGLNDAQQRKGVMFATNCLEGLRTASTAVADA